MIALWSGPQCKHELIITQLRKQHFEKTSYSQSLDGLTGRETRGEGQSRKSRLRAFKGWSFWKFVPTVPGAKSWPHIRCLLHSLDELAVSFFTFTLSFDCRKIATSRSCKCNTLRNNNQQLLFHFISVCPKNVSNHDCIYGFWCVYKYNMYVCMRLRILSLHIIYQAGTVYRERERETASEWVS